MGTIYKHELSMCNNSLNSYLFCAFLLLAIGGGTLYYNIYNAVANFEYVLETIAILFALLIPVLTMKSFAEEKKQKTDQLLYSLPLNMWQIVAGKYLAYLTVFAVPMVFVCVYPFIFSKFGNVCLSTSYGCIFAFFLLGAALTAIGMWVSSLTENQGIAAGISAVIILALYFCNGLAENLGIEGIFDKISPFERFYVYIDGVFDLTGVVYFISFAAFFLFLCVQSLEKRRYK